MKVEQISIFLENKSGRLAEVTDTLARAGINIRSLSLADTADFGILRLIVDRTEQANKVLKEGGFTVAKTEVIALQVPDVPGGLAKILSFLDGAGINVEYMYAFIHRSGDDAIVIFRFDEIDKAIRVLLDAGVRVLKGEEVHAL
jgi:hypothetical protein